MSTINLNNYEAYLLDFIEGNLPAGLTAELKTFVLAHPELEIDLDDTDLPVFGKEEVFSDFKNSLLKTENDLPNEDLLNYLEGNLSLTDRLDFEAKLSSDKDLQSELNSFKKTVLAPETNVVFEEKQKLIRTEDEFVLNSTVIAYTENQLSPTERKSFELQLESDPGLKKELALVQASKLIADTSVVYPDKESLKKESKVIVLFSFRMVAGLAAALFLVLGLIVLFRNNSSEAVKYQIAKNQKNQNQQNETNSDSSEILNVPATTEPEIKNKNIATVNTFTSSVRINSSTNSHLKQDSLKHIKVIEKREENSIATHTPTVNINKIELPLSNGDSSALASNTAAFPATEKIGVTHYTNVDALASAEDNDELPKQEKNNFWKRAVRFAQQVNGLGLKAVKGDEKDHENYMLSFNSFTVEKK